MSNMIHDFNNFKISKFASAQTGVKYTANKHASDYVMVSKCIINTWVGR